MSGERPADTWSDGSAYEAYVGRWSRHVAADFVAWLGGGPQLRWLDVGAGTGALSATIVAAADPMAVVGIDASDAYVAAARARLAGAPAQFEQGDACALPFDAEFDAAVSGLVLNFVADSQSAVAGMRRAVVRGGLVAAYLWDYAGRMEFMRYFWDAAAAVDPAAAQFDEGTRFPLCHPDALAYLWRGVGLREVETIGIEIATRFTDFEDLWRPFLGGQGAAPAYLVSLPTPQRAAVREELRSCLPVDPDGSISLVARAWAVKGRV
jgi:SAM-dependent methyltransferase